MLKAYTKPHVLNDQGPILNILQFVSRKRMRVGLEKDKDK